MLFNILLLIVGFIILIKGADVFVESSSSLASHFKLSKMLIGLTIVSFGTSAPEFAVSARRSGLAIWRSAPYSFPARHGASRFSDS